MTRGQKIKIMMLNLVMVSDDKNLLKESSQTAREYEQEKIKAFRDLSEFIYTHTPKNKITKPKIVYNEIL